MKKTFWLSYDLGLKGDYTGLYTFLDSVEAKECGNSMAVFHKDYGTDFLEKLKSDLENSVKITNSDRIYVIFSEHNQMKTKGKFLFGGRKRSPWEGYATVDTTTDEDF